MGDLEIQLKTLIKNKYGSINQFSIKTGIAYSTIDSIIKRGINNSNLSSIIKVCEALNISADGLSNGNIVYKNDNIQDLELYKHNISPEIRQKYELAEKFATDYAELLKDRNFLDITKLCNAASKELIALALGYIVGLFYDRGVNTKAVLGY